MAYKTPGVYIEEIASFPPSVVPVETAIPAFIGYTQESEDENGSSLSFIPKKIESLLDFESYYGGDFVPTTYQVTLDTADDNTVTAINPHDASDVSRRYYMYNSIKSFYQNGGGACYIISVGSYSTAPSAGDTATPVGLLGGLSRLQPVDEPTLILFPDGVSLDNANFGTVQAAALTQCADLQDRFFISDLRNGDQDASITLNPFNDFRNNVGTGNLKYGAAYYPWLKTIYKPSVNFSQLVFFDTTPAAIVNGTIDTLTGDAETDALTTTARAANAAVIDVISAVSGALPGGHPLTLTRSNFSNLNSHFSDLYEVVRNTSSTDTAAVRTAFTNLVTLPRAIALAFQSIDALTTLGNELEQVLSNLSSDNNIVDNVVGLIAFEKNSQVRSTVASGRTIGNVETDYANLDATVWIGSTTAVPVALGDIGATTDTFGTTVYERAVGAGALLVDTMSNLASAILSLIETAEYLVTESEKVLFSGHSVFASVKEQIEQNMSVIPCSGAVVGVYAAVDRRRGVWKAPANVSLSGVIGPAVKINDEAQGNLNVHTTGKSINAIRSFSGKGTLIWGSRTLDGNSNEWRYVPVRRFFNMAEESIKKATSPFVFEPNDANTWVRVRAMIENFLTLQWRAGALAGEKTAHAFYVKIGLGETMTAQDILEGRMIVEIGMAVVRPAEFIVLKFAHKMQES